MGGFDVWWRGCDAANIQNKWQRRDGRRGSPEACVGLDYTSDGRTRDTYGLNPMPNVYDLRRCEVKEFVQLVGILHAPAACRLVGLLMECAEPEGYQWRTSATSGPGLETQHY